MQTFIQELARAILGQDTPLHQCLVILPSKRAEVFLLAQLESELQEVQVMPLITTVSSFTEEASGLQHIDTLPALVLLHQAFVKAQLQDNPKATPDTLESFLKWGHTLMSDFAEIDRYLLNPNAVLKELYNIKRIEELFGDDHPLEETPLMGKYAHFVSLLPGTYDNFKSALLSQSMATAGLGARDLAENPARIDTYLQRANIQKVFVCGINAASKAEEQLFKYLNYNAETTFLWDGDAYYVENASHEAGYFLRKHRNNTGVFGTQTPGEFPNRFSGFPKDFFPIGASKITGSAKVIGDQVATWLNSGIAPADIAVVLANENLLEATLSYLPKELSSINITMGFPMKHTPVWQTIKCWFDCLEFAQRRGGNTPTFYHTSLAALFSDPLFQKYWTGTGTPNQWAVEIVEKNRAFSSLNDWTVLKDGPPAYAQLLSSTQTQEALVRLQAWLKAAGSVETDPLIQHMLHSHYTLTVMLEQLVANHAHDPLSLSAVSKLYQKALITEKLDFVGEPLSGLQIMGILETRLLSFPYVIIAGLNEGVLPLGRTYNSFFPYDLKRAYELPSYEEKDAVFAYHFYRLVQRAKEGVFIYNTDPTTVGTQEPSRFITQLEVETVDTGSKVHPHQYYRGEIYPKSLTGPFEASRTEAVRNAIETWLSEKGISASSINQYLSRPHQFYQERLVGSREDDEVEESISDRLLGVILHKGLEVLYAPFMHKSLPTIDKQDWLKRGMEAAANELVEKMGYPKGMLHQGKNVLLLEVCKSMMDKFLHYDIQRTQNIVLGHLERPIAIEVVHPTLQRAIKAKGFIDRTETVDGVFHIWDYKSGQFKSGDTRASNWDVVWGGTKSKVLQLLFYAWLVYRDTEVQHPPFPWRAGLLKVQSAQPENFLAVEKTQEIDEAMVLAFEQGLFDLLEEMVHTEDLFVQPPPKNY